MAMAIPQCELPWPWLVSACSPDPPSASPARMSLRFARQSHPNMNGIDVARLLQARALAKHCRFGHKQARPLLTHSRALARVLAMSPQAKKDVKEAADTKVEQPPRKKQKPASVGDVPVPVAQPEQPREVAGSPMPAKPTLPPCLDADVDVVALMRSVILHTKRALRNHVEKDELLKGKEGIKELHAYAPLGIVSESSSTALSSYKAPWCQAQAEEALASTSMYEAAGNLFWLNPFPQSGEDAQIAGSTPSWQQIEGMAAAFRVADGQNENVMREGRIIFPVVLPVHAPRAEELAQATFSGVLRLVTGHAALYGWYVAMFEALDSGSLSWTRKLWQAALTVTIQAHVVSDASSLALLSMQRNSDYFQTAKSMADSFPSFARKLGIALKGVKSTATKLAHCASHSVRFNGSLVNRTLITAASTYVDRVGEDTHMRLMRFERKFGQDVLTAKYNNLTRIIQICNKEVDSCPKMWPDADASTLLGHVLDYIAWALTHEVVKPQGVTVEWLDKSRDGTPGCVQRVFAKAQCVEHFRGVAEEFPTEGATRAELLKVLRYFRSYAAYGQAFGSASTPAGGGEEREESVDPYETARLELGKVGASLLDFLFDVFAGEHDKDIASLVQAQDKCVGTISWGDLEGEAGKKLRELSRQLGLHKGTVTAAAGAGAPPAASRSLKRAMSRHDDDEEGDRAQEVLSERAEAWRTAQATRKKRAQVSAATFSSADALQRWFEKQTAAHNFAGKAGEAHRVFVFSADTFGQESEQPWATTAATKEINIILDFLARQTGNADVILSFDGRNLTDRKALAAGMSKARNSCELWVVYLPTRRLGRRVAWSSDTREVGWLSLPVPRTSVATKERSDEAAAWAATTHSSVYAGVPQVPWDGLPQITRADKERVLGMQPEAPPEKVCNTECGMPLYWQERKPVLFWEDILQCLDASMVVDLSPGSGSIGRACLRSGVQYIGAARNDAHASWLCNVLDREACELITTKQSPLFEQDLAALLKVHFADVLQQLATQHSAEDHEPEED